VSLCQREERIGCSGACACAWARRVCVCVVCPCGVAHGQAGMQWQKHPKRRSMGRRMFFGRDPVTSMSPAVIHSIDHARTKMKSN
jgi:hypothetical protein